MPLEKTAYLEKLKLRRKESHVYRRYQLLGLQIAELLGDRAHKALYIKLVKERGSEELLGLAKRISGLEHVTNKGAYFMSCLPKGQTPTKMRKSPNVRKAKPARLRTFVSIS
jgi:hypothetical protein